MTSAAVRNEDGLQTQATFRIAIMVILVNTIAKNDHIYDIGWAFRRGHQGRASLEPLMNQCSNLFFFSRILWPASSCWQAHRLASLNRQSVYQTEISPSLADQIGQLGTTPWYSELKAPAFALTSADITGGQAIISVPSNQGTNTTSAFVFQNLATPFRLGTYTLSTAFTASTPLTLSLIENSGIGLGFLNNATTTSRGTEVSSSANSPGNLSLTAVSGDSGTLTYAFTNTSFTSGNLGIELFAGYNASLSNGLLTGDSFGPVNLTFTPAAVPEPSTASLVAVGTISLGGFLALRSRRRPLA